MCDGDGLEQKKGETERKKGMTQTLPSTSKTTDPRRPEEQEGMAFEVGRSGTGTSKKKKRHKRRAD